MTDNGLTIKATDIQPTMSSIEISVLTGKRHDNVKRDIDKMLIELEKKPSSFLRKSPNGRNQIISEYMLPKEETLILISGYNIKMRAKIIKRWIELEEKENVINLPQSFSEALQLAADQAKQIEQQKPMVEFAKAIEGTQELISVGDFAKISGLFGRNTLFKKMRENDILQKTNIPYQRLIKRGYFEVKEKVIKPGDILTVTTYITGKGQLWLNKKLNEWV